MRKFSLGAVAFIVATGLCVSVAARRASAAPEEHPVIHQAIEQLQQTREILNREADRDFHGHRAAAVKHIDAALHELHEALESDKH